MSNSKHGTFLTVTFFAGVAAGLLLPITGYSMPNFAREYGKQCSMCHTQVPQLNRKGYEFRAAGYRFPDEIGEDDTNLELKSFKPGDFAAARLQSEISYKSHNPASGEDSSSTTLEFKEVTLYPLTGSWGRYFASLGEFSMAPDDVFETENAYVRAVYGDIDGFFTGRLGIMHAWEGWGASDRPIGLSRPLFQTQRATGSPFKLWSLDEFAAELGYYFARTGTTVTARIGNGILWKEDGSGAGEPAQGGELNKLTALPADDEKSYQLVVNQFVRDDSGLTLYYYLTRVPSPNPFDADGNLLPGPFTEQRVERFAAYGNFYVLPEKLNLLVGFGTGSDDLDDPIAGDLVGDSRGYFGEVDYFAIPQVLAAGLRYDTFDPQRDIDHNSQDAITVFANYRPSTRGGLQFIGEYQHKTTEAGALPGENDDDQFLLRIIFIY